MAQFCSICRFNSNQFSIWSIQDWAVVNIVPFRRVHELMAGNGQSGTIAIGFWRIAIQQSVALHSRGEVDCSLHCILSDYNALLYISLHCIVIAGGLVFALETVNSRLTDWTLDGHWTV